ncbi:MAG: restriction endonuclease subunit S [Cyanobacteriota bacterium]|jgi:type I restriction enzyme S subunit
MSFPRYPAYKDSGVEWLGEVPEHWEEKPLKTVTSINDEVLSESVSIDHEIEYVDISSVSLANGIERTESVIFGDAPSRARRIPRDGDVLVSTVRTYLKAIAPVVSPPCNLVASTGFAVVRPQRGIHPGYLKYALQEEHFIQQVISRSTGVSYPAINASDIARIPLSLPKQSEQLAIATFLDRETAKIDALIAEQQRLIELLQEKRQAVISHAVTKGLNPDAPMKDSGVEWLGEVPEHWEVMPLKRIVAMQSGNSITAETIESAGAYPVYGGNGLRGYTSSFTHSGEFVLIGRQGALCGNINYATGRFFASEHAVVATARKSVDVTWLGEMMRTMNLNQYSVSAAQPGLSVELIGNVRTIYAPLEEQRRLAGFLSDQSETLAGLSTEAFKAIDLLQERRSALISAAVTGRIDVRGLVPEVSE